MKKYTIEQVDQIIDEQDWHSCIANNQKDGEYEFGIDTIMVSIEEGQDYFGEFVGNDDDGYEFSFYV